MSPGQPLLVGVDVGTTLTKAGAVDLEGREVAHAAAPTVWQREPSGGHARPEDLFAGAVAALRAVLQKAPAGEVLGLGVTSMAETAVLMGPAGTGIGPAVAWYDGRAAEDFTELKSFVSDGGFGRVTGLGTSQIPTVATLRWLVRNVDAARRAASAASVAEWVVTCLGGDRAAEASLASRTGALSVASRRWWPEVLEWAGLPATLFPPVRAAGAPFGRAHDLPPGLDRLEGAVLTVAGHDHLCGALGMGASLESQVMDDCGTAEALVRAVPATQSLDLAAGLPFGIMAGWHVLPGQYALMGGFPLGLEFVALLERLGVANRHGRTDLDSPALALNLPQASLAASTGGLPPMRPPAGVKTGVPAEQAWWTAVASAVAGSRRLLDGLERLGGPVVEVRMSGGWSRNPLLMALKSEVFPTLSFPVVKEAGTRGAALLAGLAAGAYGGVADLPPPDLEPVPHHKPEPHDKPETHDKEAQ